MTALLHRAFEEASLLPESEQGRLAAWRREEIASEHRWDEAFGASPDVLAALAAEALGEHHRGHTERLDPGAP